MIKKKVLKYILVISLIMVIAFVLLNEYCMLGYLESYGFGIKELPRTNLVFLGISKGFTVSSDEDWTTFIGRHDYIYEDLMEKNGYYECDRMGEAGFYSKISEERTNEFDHDFCIVSQNDWCFWFRVYSINNGYRIEDFLGDEAMN